MTASEGQQGTHFWFMSLFVPNSMGFATYRRSGHFNPKPGTTRFDAFELLLAAVKEQSPELQHDAVVISFDIQPNQI